MPSVVVRMSSVSSSTMRTVSRISRSEKDIGADRMPGRSTRAEPRPLAGWHPTARLEALLRADLEREPRRQAPGHGRRGPWILEQALEEEALTDEPEVGRDRQLDLERRPLPRAQEARELGRVGH